MSYIKTWSDGALQALLHVIQSRVEADPSNMQEREELKSIEQELAERRARLNTLPTVTVETATT